MASQNGLLKMKELAERSGVSSGTIKHYLREGLLPEPVKTSRNMAYYPPEFVERIRLIKQLQEERFMPLKLIRSVLDEDPERARALVELEDRILERALQGDTSRVSAAELRRRYDIPQEVLERLAELEILTPNSRGYGERDVQIVEAISRFRAGGWDERIGFTVYDTVALQARARGPREGGGPGADGPAGRRARARSGGRPDPGGDRAAARPHRRAAPEAARGRAPPPARRARVR